MKLHEAGTIFLVILLIVAAILGVDLYGLGKSNKEEKEKINIEIEININEEGEESCPYQNTPVVVTTGTEHEPAAGSTLFSVVEPFREPQQ